MYKFTRLPRLTDLPLLIQHENFSIGNGFAHRRRPPIKFFRGKIRGAKSLCQSVHQEYFCGRKHSAQNLENRLRHCTASIGDVAQMRERLFRESRIGLRQQAPECGHASESADFFLKQGLHNFARKYEVNKHASAALFERGYQLIHPGIETERENREDALVLCDAEVSGDDPAARNNVGMTQHYTLRLAR